MEQSKETHYEATTHCHETTLYSSFFLRACVRARIRSFLIYRHDALSTDSVCRLASPVLPGCSILGLRCAGCRRFGCRRSSCWNRPRRESFSRPALCCPGVKVAKWQAAHRAPLGPATGDGCFCWRRIQRSRVPTVLCFSIFLCILLVARVHVEPQTHCHFTYPRSPDTTQ